MAQFDAFDTMEATVPGGGLATNGTIVFTYLTKSPARAAASFVAGSGAKLVAGQGFEALFSQGASNFSLSYSTTTVTLTYLGATTIPVGTKLYLQSPLAQYADIVALTDNSGGTASTTIAAQSGAYVQATQANTIASLAATINQLVTTVNAIQALLRAREIYPGQVVN